MKKRTPLSIILSLFCGLLASLPLIFPEIPYLSFVLFIPYLLFLRTRGKKATLRFYYLSGLFFFLGYYGGAFSFFAAMYPLDFAGLGTLKSVAVLFAAMLLLPLFQAWFSAFAILLLGLFQKKRLLCFPLSFSLTAACLYTVFAYAQNLTWAGVPWANTAVGIASSPLLIQGASLFGSGFLIFFIIFSNAALSEAFVLFRDCRDKGAFLCVLCAASLFLSTLALGAVRLFVKDEKSEDGTLTVAMLQGAYPATENTYVSAHLRACRYEARRAAAEAKIDLMLWSESVLTYALQSDPDAEKFFSDIARETGAIQVIGAFSAEPTPEGEDGYYNALFLFYPDGTKSEEVYHKRRPVPFGEYLPLPWLFERLIPALTEISMLSRDTTAGEGSSLFHTELGVFGGLVCFDSIYPALARESVRDGAEILLLSTDDSWFDGSFGKSLHLRHAALRAVENGRTVVRTGNTGVSAVIDGHGEILTSLPLDTRAHGIAAVRPERETTLYTRMGDVFVFLTLGFLVTVPPLTLWTRKRKGTLQKG